MSNMYLLPKKIKKKCLPIDKNDRIVWLMDENTLQKDIYYRLVSLLAEDYLFEGVNCCLFEMFKKNKKKNLSSSMSVHSTFTK